MADPTLLAEARQVPGCGGPMCRPDEAIENALFCDNCLSLLLAWAGQRAIDAARTPPGGTDG